jgi:Xaa-Pro aminopeptidase
MAARERLSLLNARMHTSGLELFVAVSTSFHNFLDADPVFVLTGFRPMGECAVLVGLNDASLIVTPAWDVERARQRSGFTRIVPAVRLGEAIKAVAGRFNADPDKIAVAGAGALPLASHREVMAAIGGKPQDGDDMLLKVAGIKTEDEIDDARTATRIAEKGYERLLEVARPGMHEFELAAELYCHMKSLGADENFLLMSASQHNQAVRAPSRRILERGDIILGEISPSYNGQFSQICRSAVIGPATEQQLEKFDILKRAMAVGKKAGAAGATAADAARGMNGVIGQAGYADYCRPPFMRVRGHGLGNLSSLPGDIDTENHTKLETDMVFVMHPNQYFPDVGYLLCGEPVRVTKKGCEALSEREAELDSIPV